MDRRRKSPPSIGHKGLAVGAFVIGLAILVVCVYLGIGMLTRYDYTEVLPEDADLRAKFAIEGYVPPQTQAEATPKPQSVFDSLPTPMPAPRSTPLPLQLYSIQNTRMVMPENARQAGEAHLTSISVSQADDNRSVLVRGWAFLEGYDAAESTIYLVVSAKAGQVQRFYEMSKKPGSSGVVHPASKGRNLERADFEGAFKVGTYEEGPYRMGALVVHPAGRGQTEQGYFEFEEVSQFYVKGNKVTSVG